MAPILLAIIGLFAGVRLAYGAASWTHWLLPMIASARICTALEIWYATLDTLGGVFNWWQSVLAPNATVVLVQTLDRADTGGAPTLKSFYVLCLRIILKKHRIEHF